VNVDGGQVGCKADRLQKFIDRGKATKEAGTTSYELTQFCNLYRSQQVDLDQARKDVMPLFGVVVNHHLSRSQIDIEKSVNALLELDYPPEKVKIILSCPTSQDFELMMHYTNILKQKYRAVELILHLVYDQFTKDRECFSKLLQATYFVKFDSGFEIDPNIFSKVDNVLNVDLKQTCMFQSPGISIVLKSVVQEKYYESCDYDKTIDLIRKIAMEQNKYEEV
jgi:hypothetical protein